MNDAWWKALATALIVRAGEHRTEWTKEPPIGELSELAIAHLAAAHVLQGIAVAIATACAEVE